MYPFVDASHIEQWALHVTHDAQVGSVIACLDMCLQLCMLFIVRVVSSGPPLPLLGRILSQAVHILSDLQSTSASQGDPSGTALHTPGGDAKSSQDVVIGVQGSGNIVCTEWAR